MKTVLKLDDGARLVAFADAGAVEPPDLSATESLRVHAESGDVFFIEAGGPWLSSIHVYAGEPVPERVEEVYAAHGERFLLRLPSGRLGIRGAGESSGTGEPVSQTLEVPAGDYAVSVLDGSKKNAPALVAREEALVDAADWRLYHRINDLGAAGCLAVAAGMVFVLVPYTRHELWFLLPLFLIPPLAYSLLKRLPGYARVDERLTEYESGLPQIALSLERVEGAEGLAGGGYRVR